MPEQDLFGEVPAPALPPRRPRTLGSPAQHTWFFALRPSAEDAARIEALGRQLMHDHSVSGTRLNAERLHITLELVGHDVDDDVVEAARAAADKVRFAPIEVRFDAAMTFAAPSGPFVLLGEPGSGGMDGVRQLRTSLGCAMADQGFRPPKSYEPHMTLGYDPRHRVERRAIVPIGFQAVEFFLIKSHIGQSRHEVVRQWPLGG